jgi:molecular chaperone GrpE
VSDFHEEFEGHAAGAEPAAEDPADTTEPETADVDAAVGGAGYGHSPAEPAAELDPDESGVAEGLNEAAASAADAEAPAPEDTAAQYLALAQRTQADFENYRKRAARDAALAQQRGIAKLAKDLLPALDNLERAIAHAGSEDPLLEGIKLVRSDMASALTRAGIEAFDPAGESFDPNVHEAVAQFPKEGVDPGTVTEVYQQGYRLGDTVLRPARVVVAS